MKVLVAHNYYQNPGGEDIVFRSEIDLLRRHGHELIEYVRNNKEIADYNFNDYATLGFRTIWNWETYADIKRLIQEHKPDLAHFHNMFPLISPAAYDACSSLNVPVVQTLHNFRMFCPAGNLSYKGNYCERCLGKSLPWTGIARSCYRESRPQTAVIGILNAVHRKRGTWTDKIARYIVPNDASRDTFVRAGFPEEKIAVKPHFLDDPGWGVGRREYALYVGRLTELKGVRTLLTAWKTLTEIPLKICGDGPLQGMVEEAAVASNGNIELMPFVRRAEVLTEMKNAAFLVWPSETPESFGLVAMESFACGRPVICSSVGPMPNLVEAGVTGIHFRACDPQDLAEKVRWAWSHPKEMARMGRAARMEYETKYFPERNYEKLLEVYTEAIALRRTLPLPEEEVCGPS